MSRPPKVVTENEMENDLDKVAEVYWDLYKNYEKGDTELNKAIDDWAGRRYLGNSIDSKLRYAQYISEAAKKKLEKEDYKTFTNEHVIPKENYFLKQIRDIIKKDNLALDEKEKQVKEFIKKRHRICLITADQNTILNKTHKEKLPTKIAKSLEEDPLKEMELEEEFSRYIECGAFEGQKIYKIKGYTKYYEKQNRVYKIDAEEYFTIPKKKKS